MKRNRSSNLLLKLIYVTLLPVLEGQEVEVSPEMTGYLGHDVTLPCRLIQTPNSVNITQVQWDYLQTEKEKITIIVVNSLLGESIPESPLKGRIEVAGQSLIIRAVEMADKGSYTCSIVTFPFGSFERVTNLVVREQMPLSTGMISAIVTVVVLLLVIITAVVYLYVVRRCIPPVRHHVFIDTANSATAVTRPSVIVREEDVVYSDVMLKPYNNGTPSSSDKLREAAYADNVTYSEVIISPRQSK